MITRFISLIIAILLFGIPAYADADADTDAARLMDPSKHVRMVYDRFNSPDSKIFAVLLTIIQTKTETSTEEKLDSWVWGEMNKTYSPELGAWVTPQLKTLRHSREEIREFVDLLLEVTDRSFETELNLRRELFCPVGKFATMEKRFAALERHYINKQVDDEYYLNYTMERISEQSRADLRAWLSRLKVGFRERVSNHRTLWAGRESLLDVAFSNFCEVFGANQ